MEIELITCMVCNKNYQYNRKKGHTKTKCNSCNVNERRFAVKYRALEYKGGKCQICGYSKCKEALCFHHLNPKEKDFSLSGNHTRTWSSIQQELDKCTLLCLNCHAEVHYQELNTK